MKKQLIEIKTLDGLCETFLAYPEKVQKLPVVLFFMDGIGLRPRIYEMVEKIAAQGYLVIAPHLFYRERKLPVIDYKAFYNEATRADVFKEIRAMSGRYTADMGKSDAEEFLKFAKCFPIADSSRIAAVGYCMGGGQAIRAGGNFPDSFKAIASFHGGNLATDSETSPHLYFKKMKAELYIAYADKDSSMPPEMIEKVESALKETTLVYKTELYPNCLHGWTMADLPAYNKAGEEKHFHTLFDLLQRTF